MHALSYEIAPLRTSRATNVSAFAGCPRFRSAQREKRFAAMAGDDDFEMARRDR
jgi:hypothetical protein